MKKFNVIGSRDNAKGIIKRYEDTLSLYNGLLTKHKVSNYKEALDLFFEKTQNVFGKTQIEIDLMRFEFEMIVDKKYQELSAIKVGEKILFDLKPSYESAKNEEYIDVQTKDSKDYTALYKLIESMYLAITEMPYDVNFKTIETMLTSDAFAMKNYTITGNRDYTDVPKYKQLSKETVDTMILKYFVKEGRTNFLIDIE